MVKGKRDNVDPLELQKEFIYIEVPAGQGVYTWIDYNENNIKELNEFEIAIFSDQASYIKVYTPNNNYIKIYQFQYNQNLNINLKRIIKGESVIKDSGGNIKKIICTYDPKSKSGSGSPESLRKVKGTIHWVDKNNHEKISINIYDKLFDIETPDDIDSGEYKSQINKNSLMVVENACAESSIKNAEFDKYYQFQRKGYFKLDSKNSKKIFNRTVTLRDNTRY